MAVEEKTPGLGDALHPGTILAERSRNRPDLGWHVAQPLDTGERSRIRNDAVPAQRVAQQLLE